MKYLLALVLALAACSPAWITPKGAYAVPPDDYYVQWGRALAEGCLKDHHVWYDSTIVGNVYLITDSLHNEGWSGKAFFASNRIYVVESQAKNNRIWAHEFTHLLGRINGHPKLFTTCGFRGDGADTVKINATNN